MRILFIGAAVAAALFTGGLPASAADAPAAGEAAVGKAGPSSAQNNPLYQDTSGKGENPLYEGKSDLRQVPRSGPKHSSDASAGKGAEKTAQPTPPTGAGEKGAAQHNPHFQDNGLSGEMPR